MLRIYAITASTALAVLLGVTWWLSRPVDDAFAACRTSTVGGGQAAIGGPFTLVDENGNTVTDADILTKPALVYFGYTYCPDVCPIDTYRNGLALTLLEERGYDAMGLFISVDPGRDTPEQLKEFTDLMHPDIIGLTGTEEQIKAAAQEYKAFYQKQETAPGDEDYYLIDHSTFTYLVLPKQGFVEFFRRDNTPEEIAESMACFIDATK